MLPPWLFLVSRLVEGHIELDGVMGFVALSLVARVGYADAAAFRRVFRQYAGESPRGRRARPSSRENS
jgi:hypothetical protein